MDKDNKEIEQYINTDVDIKTEISSFNIKSTLKTTPSTYHLILEQELMSLIGDSTVTIHWTIFGATFGAFISFLVCLLTVKIDNPTIFATFVGIDLIFFLAFVYCLIMVITKEIVLSKIRKKYFSKS